MSCNGLPCSPAAPNLLCTRAENKRDGAVRTRQISGINWGLLVIGFFLERNVSKTSYERRKAHRALGRTVKEGKADETQAAAWKTAEEKRVAKLPKK